MTEDGGFDFNVALSFAGEDRAYVRRIALALREREVSIFFDEERLADMWGEDLGDYLDEVYRRRSRYALIFVSRHYVAKAWPTHERKSALARAIESRLPSVLPIRLDDTELPGLRPTTGYIDARKISIEGIADAIQQKLGMLAPTDSVVWDGKTPRTEEALEFVAATRPPGWEYFLYGGYLSRGLVQLEEKYHDHELGYARPTHVSVDDDDAADFLGRALDEVRRIVGQLETVLAPGVQEKAFGPPGQPGDADRVERLAGRLVSIYEDLLNWSAQIRGTAVSEDFRFSAIKRGFASPSAVHIEPGSGLRSWRRSADRMPGA